MKKSITIITMGIVALPLISGALTVRTEHRASSGGVTVSEGAATVTGDQSSSVSVQNVISGTRGHVQITTEKDGVTTTETHTLNGSGGGSVQVITPPPALEDTSGRTPRENRGLVAVQTTNTVLATPSAATVRTTSSVSNTNSAKKSSQLVVASVTHVSSVLGTPTIVTHVGTQGHSSVPHPHVIRDFLSRIFAMFAV